MEEITYQLDIFEENKSKWLTCANYKTRFCITGLPSVRSYPPNSKGFSLFPSAESLCFVFFLYRCICPCKNKEGVHKDVLCIIRSGYGVYICVYIQVLTVNWLSCWDKSGCGFTCILFLCWFCCLAVCCVLCPFGECMLFFVYQKTMNKK